MSYQDSEINEDIVDKPMKTCTEVVTLKLELGPTNSPGERRD